MQADHISYARAFLCILPLQETLSFTNILNKLSDDERLTY